MMYENTMNAQYGRNMSREKLLKEISMISFAIVDLTLYLDTHSDDQDAVAYVKQYITIYNRLCEEYACQYGPLKVRDAVYNDCKDWKWADMPLPWEGGCN